VVAGDGLERSQLQCVWNAACALAVIFGFGLTPWEAIRAAMEHTASRSLVGFAAGYTIPAIVGFATLTRLMVVRRHFDRRVVAAVAALLLGATAFLCQELGLRRVTDLSGLDYLVGAYLNHYGWSLMVGALAIGAAAGLSVGVRSRG
jgi:hypothetical protein